MTLVVGAFVAFVNRIKDTLARIPAEKTLRVPVVFVSSFATFARLRDACATHAEDVELATERLFAKKDVIGLVLLLQLIVNALQVIKLCLKENERGLDRAVGNREGRQL